MPNEPPAPAKKNSLSPAIFLAAGIYIFITAFTVLSPILLSFLLILLVALALNPIVVRLRNLSGGRSIGTAVLALLFIFLIGLTAWAFYKPLEKSAAKFFQRLPEYWERIQKPIQKFERQIKPAESNAPGQTNIVVETPPPKESRGLFHFDGGQVVGSVSHGLQALVSNVTTILIVCLTVFVGVIYTLLNPRPIFRTFFGIIPEQAHECALRIAGRIVHFVPRWALAMLTGMAVIGAMVFFAMWPIFGFQGALVLGLISTVFEAVPYVGPILSGIPALLLAAGEGGYAPLWVVIAYVSIQLFEHNVISPVIIAGQLQQHPLAVIFSVLLCVAAFGILGVLLAVPLVAVLGILHEEIYRPRFLPHVSDKALEQMASQTLAGNVTDSSSSDSKTDYDGESSTEEKPVRKFKSFGDK